MLKRRSKSAISPPPTGGFSLIEIVLAIGIVSFALVGILGLIPVAVQSADASQQETQAALVARSIFTDLESRNDPTRVLITSTKLAEEDEETMPESKTVDLKSTDAHVYLAYNADGLPLGEIESGVFDAGKPGSGYLAHIQIKKLGAATDPPTPASEGLTEVNVSVESPGVAAKDKRARFEFNTLLRQGNPLPTTP